MTGLLRRVSTLLLNSNSILTNSKNGMTVFAPYYVQPVFKKEAQKEIAESGEIHKYTGVPVKPPLIDESCSSFQDETVRKFTNYIMEDGRKDIARRLVEKTFEAIKRSQIERYHLAADAEEKSKIELNPVVILHKAIENCQPLVNLSPVRRGGVTYQVPIPINEKRSRFLSMKWLIEAADDRDKKKILFPKQMAWELLDASNNKGRVVKRKQDLHRQCEANRAYAHYRWS